MYAEVGRPSIPPERLLKASLLIALYSVRSERAFYEDLDLVNENGPSSSPSDLVKRTAVRVVPCSTSN